MTDAPQGAKPAPKTRAKRVTLTLTRSEAEQLRNWAHYSKSSQAEDVRALLRRRLP